MNALLPTSLCLLFIVVASGCVATGSQSLVKQHGVSNSSIVGASEQGQPSFERWWSCARLAHANDGDSAAALQEMFQQPESIEQLLRNLKLAWDREWLLQPEALRQDGISMTLISAGKYKTELNAYAPLSSETRAAVQGTVDSHYDAFVRAVARGRGVPQKAVRDGMGQGRMLLPDAAKAERMIDGVATLGQVVTKMLERGQRGGGSKAFTGSARAQMARETEILKLT